MSTVRCLFLFLFALFTCSVLMSQTNAIRIVRWINIIIHGVRTTTIWKKKNNTRTCLSERVTHRNWSNWLLFMTLSFSSNRYFYDSSHLSPFEYHFRILYYFSCALPWILEKTYVVANSLTLFFSELISIFPPIFWNVKSLLAKHAHNCLSMWFSLHSAHTTPLQSHQIGYMYSYSFI